MDVVAVLVLVVSLAAAWRGLRAREALIRDLQSKVVRLDDRVKSLDSRLLRIERAGS